MTSFRPRENKEWNYLRPSEAVKPFLRFEERSPGIYELVCLDGWPSKVASNRPDSAYATKDLFLKHPTIEGYKYYARLDDTIVLVNGEKVNPLEMEGIIRQLPTVSEAVVFGAGKSSVGLILVPSPVASGLSEDEIIDSIWSSVEKAQTAMPAYAQLTKNLVKILPADTQYPRTDKGTVIRQAFYRQFHQQIEDAYEERKTENTLSLSEPELRAFIRKQLEKILPLKNPSVLTEDADFFNLGMDSLQATQLRSILTSQIDTGGHALGLNIAFDYPSINALAHYLYSLRSGTVNRSGSVEDLMQRLIEKYSEFAQHKPMPNGLKGKYLVRIHSHFLHVSRLIKTGCHWCHWLFGQSRHFEARSAARCAEDILFRTSRINHRSLWTVDTVSERTQSVHEHVRYCTKQADCCPIRVFQTNFGTR